MAPSGKILDRGSLLDEGRKVDNLFNIIENNEHLHNRGYLWLFLLSLRSWKGVIVISLKSAVSLSNCVVKMWHITKILFMFQFLKAMYIVLNVPIALT